MSLALTGQNIIIDGGWIAWYLDNRIIINRIIDKFILIAFLIILYA